LRIPDDGRGEERGIRCTTENGWVNGKKKMKRVIGPKIRRAGCGREIRGKDVKRAKDRTFACMIRNLEDKVTVGLAIGITVIVEK